jgi:hypothetical protein
MLGHHMIEDVVVSHETIHEHQEENGWSPLHD